MTSFRTIDFIQKHPPLFMALTPILSQSFNLSLFSLFLKILQQHSNIAEDNSENEDENKMRNLMWKTCALVKSIHIVGMASQHYISLKEIQIHCKSFKIMWFFFNSLVFIHSSFDQDAFLFPHFKCYPVNLHRNYRVTTVKPIISTSTHLTSFYFTSLNVRG